MEQWNEFKEKMDHELSRKPESTVCLSLLREGYKLDGEGVKKKIGFNELKSVDYIADNSSLALVEFSDLYSQQNDISKRAKALYESDFSNEETRKINKQCWGVIQKELTDKYKDTHSIINEMQKQALCSKLKTQCQDNLMPKKYWIVIAPFHPDIEDENKVELVRFIEKLKDNIATSLPSAWNVRVSIISIDNFAMPPSKKPR